MAGADSHATHRPSGNGWKDFATTVKRLGAINKMAIYFAGHLSHGNPNQDITAEQAVKVATALSDAHDALDSYDTNRNELRTTRNNAQTALRKALNGVIAEARRRLPMNSPLWDTFGVTAPKPRAPRPRKEKPAKAPKASKKSKAPSEPTTADRAAAPVADANVELSS